MQTIKQSKQALQLAIKAISQGKVVICPTDTVYGFLADASNKKAVDKIFKIKKRPKSKPLAVFVSNIKSAKQIAEIDGKQEKVLKNKWPGKFSFVLKRKSAKLYGLDKNTVAIRIPKYKFLNDLIKKVDRPLVQTSVNISNNPPLYKISDIIEQFTKQDVLLVDGGDIKKSRPSKVIDLSKEKIKILRK